MRKFAMIVGRQLKPIRKSLEDIKKTEKLTLTRIESTERRLAKIEEVITNKEKAKA